MAAAPVPPATERAILANLGLVGGVLRRVSALPEPQGYYHVSVDQVGRRDVFVKILPCVECRRQSRADEFARHVRRQNIPSSTLLPGFPLEFAPGLGMLAYEAIDGRFAADSERDAEQVGRLLARVHQALRSAAPANAEVEAATRGRLRRLSCNIPEMTRRLDLSGVAGPPSSWDIETELHKGLGESQITHGDVNHGNVLFPKLGGAPVLLDYEDTGASWFPPLVDIVFAAERFALVEREDELAETLCNAFLAGYKAESRSPIFPSAGVFAQVLESLALRSLLSVIEVEKTSKADLTSEWAKFVTLLKEPKRRTDLLSRIESAHVRS